jgi:hypothetical protein
MISIESQYSQEIIASMLKQNLSTVVTKKAQQQMSAAPPSSSHFTSSWIGKQPTTTGPRQIKGLTLGSSAPRPPIQRKESDRYVVEDTQKGGTSKHL